MSISWNLCGSVGLQETDIVSRLFGKTIKIVCFFLLACEVDVRCSFNKC